MNNQTLGTIAMICAPAMLVGELLIRGGENAAVTGVAGMVFMAGWLCSNTAMRRMRAAGTGSWGRAVLLVQAVGLVLAFMSGFFEATGLLGGGSIVFGVMDAVWPLRLLWMLVVGATVVAAKRLTGWRRFVPLVCPFWLLIGLAATPVLGEDTVGIVAFGLTAIFWTALGYVVRGERFEPLPEPATR